jgi:tRNA(Ile)-lysidine synthase
MTAEIDQVRRFAREERLFRKLERLLVAVSGGPDSVAALLVLRELGKECGFEVIAGHFDHRLRPESRADLEYVRGLCARLDVPCFTGEGDVARAAEATGKGVEETARRMRYQFLGFLGGKEMAGALATGHTADDQAETVLHRIIRGSGIRGIRGMLPRSPVPGAEAQTLIRPLLVLRRSDTVAICAAAGIEAREDLSNRDRRYSRNRIRHEILPALRLENPSVDSALINLAASAREVFESVERQALSAQPASRDAAGSAFALPALASLPGEALTLVIEREASFFRLNVELNRTRVENLRDVLTHGDGQVTFGDAEVEVSCGLVRVGPPAEVPAGFDPVVLNVPGVTRAGPWKVQVLTDQPEADPSARVAAIDPGRARGALRLRPLLPGDRLRRGDREVRIADLLGNSKVPRWERRRLLAVTDGSAVVGLPGLPQALAPKVAPEDALWVRVVRIEPPA